MFRKLRLLPALALLLALGACQKETTSTAVSQTPDTAVTTLAFGSCNRQDLPQPLWEPILQNKPQVWLWLGDNIYGDSDDMSVLQRKYNEVLQEPGYQRLRASAAIAGTWDDHDYGRNDAGKEYVMKEESAQLFWDFIGEPKDSPRRQHQGVYSAHTYGPEGKQVKVIMLDSRYNRDSVQRVNREYLANQTGDVLGEEQWAWLERELRNSKAEINLIGNGIQVLPEDHVYEKWANFPAARQRLLNLIAASGAKGVILLSGDRHIAEISKMNLPNLSYPLYEVTSSGLTHTWSKGFEVEPNRHRVGDMVAKLNFGVLNFDWDKNAVRVEMLIKGQQDSTFLREVVSF